VVDHQNDDCAEHRHDKAVDIETGDWRGSESREQKAADDGAHDSENDVEYDALASFIHNFAGNEASDKSKDDPSDNRHSVSLPMFVRAGLERAHSEAARSIAVGHLNLRQVRSIIGIASSLYSSQ
jgi:hypothetical protein